MNSLMNADIMKRHLQDMRTFGYPYNEEARHRVLSDAQFGEPEEHKENHDERL